MNKRKKGKKRLALLLACIMLVSVMPAAASSGLAGNTVSGEALGTESMPDNSLAVTPDAGEKEQKPADFTGQTKVIHTGLEEIVYNDFNQTSQHVYTDQQHNCLDLTQIVDEADSVKMGFSFEVLMTEDKCPVKAGDFFRYTIPKAYFHTEDTNAPVPVYDRGLTDLNTEVPRLIAEYTIRDNMVTVTLLKGIEEQPAVSALLYVDAAFKQDALITGSAAQCIIEETGTVIQLSEEEAAKLPPVEEPVSDVIQDTPPLQDSDLVSGAESIPENDEKQIPEDAKADSEQKPSQAPAEQVQKQEETKTILQTFRSMLDGFTSLFSEGKTAKKDLITSYEFSKVQDSLPVGYNTVELTAVSKEGGYVSNDPDPKVRFDIQSFMDEDELYAASEQLLNNYGDFPKQTDTGVTGWMAQIDAWRDKNPGAAQDYRFTYDLGEYFKTSAPLPVPITLERDGETIQIGTYEIIDGLLTVSVHPVVSFMDNVYFGCSIEAQVDQDKLSDKPLEVVINEKGKLVFQSLGTAGGEGDDPNDAAYEVTKTGPVKVTDTCITYTVRVTTLSDGKTLNGTTLQDVVPEGLFVSDAEVRLNESATPQKVLDTNGQPSAAYTFAAFDAALDNAVTSAEFTFVMELTPVKYQEYIKNGIDTTFRNQAKLIGEEPAKPLAVSEEIPTRMTSRFIQKTGKTENLEGTRYAWTVSLNTKLPLLENGYLVDTLCKTDHWYDFEQGIQIQMKEGAVDKTVHIKKENIQEISAALLPSWKELTSDKIHALGIEPEFGAGTAYYYFINETDTGGNPIPNPFYQAGNGEPEYKQRAILIIPFKGLQGTSESKAVTMKYATTLNCHNLLAEDYWEMVNTVPAAKPDISNHVNLLWTNQTGTGPGYAPVPQDEVAFGKTVDSYPGAVVKNGTNYDPATQMLTWNIDVNKLGGDLSDVVITDVLPVQDYALLGDSLDIRWYRYHSVKGLQESGTALPKNASDKDAKGRYYTISGAGAGKELKIYLGKVGVNDGGYEFYKLQFSVKLTDPSILSTQSSTQKKQNTVTLNALIGGVPKEYKHTGEQTAMNVLIDKEAVGSYNYTTFELPWKITVNPNKLDIVNAKVTDTLETGFTFGQVTKVEKNGVEDPDMKAKIKDENSAQQVKPSFSLGTIADTYTIYFTATASAGFREQKLKGGDGTKRSVAVPNIAELTGTIYGVSITDAKDTAEHRIDKQPIKKSGKYDKEKGTIAWTVEINTEHYDLSGLRMQEQLTEDGAVAVHELDPDTLEIVTVGQGADGTETETVVSYTDADFETMSVGANGFTYIFPSQTGGSPNDKTYRFRFTTCLTAKAKGASIANKVYLQDNSGTELDCSGTSNGGYDGSYEYDKNVNAQGRPRVVLRKVSKNSVNTGEGADNKTSLGLDGAQFTLEVCKFTYGSDKKLTITDPVYKYNKMRVSEAGEAVFTNIKTSTQEVTNQNNLICVLKEEQAAEGYQNDGKPHFIYFATSDGRMIDADIASIRYDSTDYDTAYYQYHQINESGNMEAATVVMPNAPVPSSFSFDKTQVKLSEYSNVNGTITKQEEAAANVKFSITSVGAGGKLQPVEAVSDTSGKVQIQNLDPGKYLLTETVPDQGHKPGSVEFTVTLNENKNGYDYAFVPKSAKGGLKLSADNKSISNDLNTTSVSFTKYVKYEDGSGKQQANNNKELLPNATFQLENISGSSIGPKEIKLEAMSGADGKVTFQGLPIGTYHIYEVYDSKSVPGYVASGAKELVYELTVSELNDGKTMKTELIAQRLDKGDTNTAVHNTPVKGSLSFQKTVDSAFSGLNGISLADAQFGLFRKIGNTVAEEALYQAVSDVYGTVLFQNVEYGDYVLRETKVPAGYQKTADITVTKGDLKNAISGANPTTFQYVRGTALTNRLFQTDVKLVKKDQGANPMEGISFYVYRRGDAVTELNGTGYIVSVPSQTETFYTYLPAQAGTEKGVIRSDSEGALTLTGLPYGDYLLVEDTTGLELQDEASKVAVLITVRNEGTAGTVTVYENEQAELQKNASDNGYVNVPAPGTANWDTAKDKWLTRTEKDNGRTVIINKKKFGFINVNKAAGELKTDTLLEPYLDGDNTVPLAGAVFEISRKAGDGTYVHYLTLQTNAKGQLERSKDGESYQDISVTAGSVYKHLWYGDYQIQETKAPEGFDLNPAVIPFTIGDAAPGSKEGAGHEGTVWITSSGQTGTAVYVPKETNPPAITDALFLNGISRGAFQVTKIETGNADKKLSGAAFTVWSNNTQVASVKESTSAGTYYLTNEKEDGTYQEKNSAGYPYLHKTAGTWKLLSGTYVIKETKAPDGYELAGDMEVTVTSGVLAQEITVADEAVSVQITKKSAEEGASGNLTGAEFVLKGSFSDTKDGEKTVTDQNAAAVTGLIAGNTYTLTETKSPDGYARYLKEITFLIHTDGTIKDVLPIDSQNWVSVQGSELIVKNAPIELGFAKEDTDNKPVGEQYGMAQFSITPEVGSTFADGTVEAIAIDATGGKAALLKKQLIAGNTYRAEETMIPAGYTKAADFTFTISPDGKAVPQSEAGSYVSYSDNKMLLTVQDTPITFSILKTDEQSGLPLANACFILTPEGTGETFADKSMKKELVTGEDGQAEAGPVQLIAGKTYRITESKAPTGYVTPKADAGYAIFTVDADGKSAAVVEGQNPLGLKLSGTQLTVTNKKTDLSVYKADENGNPAEGAKLSIYKWNDADKIKEGEAILSFDSKKQPERFEGTIPEGTYVLEEEQRPAGYLLAAPVYFTLAAGNEITVIPGPDGIKQGTCEKNTITMTDKQILVSIPIVKICRETKEPVANVTFDIFDDSKTKADAIIPVQTKTTDSSGTLLFTDLSEGSYTIRENLEESLGQGFAADMYLDVDWSAKVKVTADPDGKAAAVTVDGNAFDGTKDVLTVENPQFTAALELIKQDEEDGTVLAGVKFLLEQKKEDGTYAPYVQNQNAGIYVTDENGKLQADGLIRGEYRLTEAETVRGYVLDRVHPFTATFALHNADYNQTVQINKEHADNSKWELTILEGQELLREDGIINKRDTGSVLLRKADSNTGEGLDKVTYELSKKKGEQWISDDFYFMTGKTYESLEDKIGSDAGQPGLLSIHGLSWGNYKLKEKTALAGYQKDGAEYEFTIGRSGTELILEVEKGTIVNVPNELILEKRASDIGAGDSGDGNLLDGATFTITNRNNPQDTFTETVSGGRITVKKKLTGGADYILRETKAPKGYCLNPSEVPFTMEEDGTLTGEGIAGNTITMYDSPTHISFQKAGKYNESCSDMGLQAPDPEAVRPLAGAEFTAYAADAPDIAVQTAVSGEDGMVVFEKLPLGEYRIRETKAPQGHVPDETDYYATVTSGVFGGLMMEDADHKRVLVEKNTVVNDVYRADISFIKVNEQKPEEVLQGSKYGLFKYADSPSIRRVSKAVQFLSKDADTTKLIPVAEAITDENGRLTFRGVLMDVSYVVKELEAPDGSYVSAKPMQITFGTETGADGQIHIRITNIDDGSGTVKIDPVTGEIIWLEPPVEVSIEKITPDGNMLAGARLEVRDEEDVIVESFLSGLEPYLISGKLVIGKTYRLVETQAPQGYQMAEPVSFTIEDSEVGPGENRIQKITMTDRMIPSIPSVGNDTQFTPETEAKEAVEIVAAGGQAARTGDRSEALRYLFALLVAGGIILGYRRKVRR